MITIGISGDRGSFSEEAVRTYARKANGTLEDYEIAYLVSVENVLKDLEQARIDLGVFPIENSNGGIVIEAVHAMSKHNFEIVKMFEIDVHHNLLVRRGVKAEHVTSITSHDQAIKQCRMYLRRIWPNVAHHEYADTAKAAADLASGKLPDTTAVIASAEAAEIYGLDILEASIQDLKFNFTHFIAAKHRRSERGY